MRPSKSIPELCARWRALRWLLALAVACDTCSAIAADGLSLRVSADYTWDDNVNRGTSDHREHDRFASADASATLPLSLSDHWRLLLTGTLGGDSFHEFTGLTRGYAEFDGELQFRSSGQYTAPIWGLFVSQSVDWYQSNLRDGDRTAIGLSVRKPATDRIFLFGAASYLQRNSHSTVFDTKEYSLRGNLDYALAPRNTLYLGLEYRDGDSVSTTLPQRALRSISEVAVADDVFTSPQFFSYRYAARTGIARIGYNFAVTGRQAFDISYQYVYTRPKEQPSSAFNTGTVDYADNQITLSYLISF